MKKNPLGRGQWRKPETLASRRRPGDNKKWLAFETELIAKGFPVKKRDRRKKLSNADVRSLSAKWEKYSSYLNPRNEFEFVPMKKNDPRRKKVSDKLPKEAFTPKGVFVRRPKLVGRMRGKVKVTITQEGFILGQIGKRQRRVTVRLSPELIARDPRMAVEKALAEADAQVPLGCKKVGCLLKVNGFNARRGTISINIFFEYMAGKPVDEDNGDELDDETGLLEAVMDPKRQEHGKALSAKQVSQIFTIEVVYRCRKVAGRKRKTK